MTHIELGDIMSLGEILRDLRKDKGFTLASVAHALNIGTSTMGAYERGKRFPSYEILVQIADYYNVNIDYLFGRTRIQTSWKDVLQQMKVGVNTIDLLRSVGKLSKDGQEMVLEYILFIQAHEKKKSNLK